MNKVLLVSPAPPPIGGITSWTVEYMNQMPNLGCKPILVNTTVIGKRLENNAKISFYDELLRLIKIRKNIKKSFREHKIEVLHYNASCFTFGLVRDYLVLAPFFNKVPIVYHCHCNLGTNVNSKLASCFFSKLAKRVKRVLVLNQDSLRFAKRYTERAELVPNFIEKAYVDTVEVREHLKNIVFVGRVSIPKGIREILASAKKMEDVNFHIIGPDPERLLDNVSDRNVIVHGAKTKEQVIGLLKEMDAVILPSYTEGFPLVVMEGMACGLPVIATPVGSIPDMIGNEGGILVKSQDSESIVSAIQNMQAAKIRKSMAEYNLHKVRTEYLTENVLSKMLEIYEKIVI